MAKVNVSEKLSEQMRAWIKQSFMATNPGKFYCMLLELAERFEGLEEQLELSSQELCGLPEYLIEKLRDKQDKPREIIAWQQKRIKELEERYAAALRANELTRTKIIDIVNKNLHVW